MDLRRFLLGRPLADAEAGTEQLRVPSAVPVLGLDALASAAYGPEAALTVLLPLGAAGLRYVLPITACIVVLLLAVQASYRQTISAYPDGGGSYTVAKENLGRLPSLTAAAALSIDYVLNVAVAIAAGVGALASVFPALLPHTLGLCLVLLALLALANLRGLRTAGALFMLPTYLFVASLGAVLAAGAWKALGSGLHPAAVVAPPRLPPAAALPGAWLLLRAFAAGCTALTGVEAVSNAVPVFREPRQRRARWTLATIIAVLVVLLAGIAALSHAYGVGATPPGRGGYQSVLSQLVGAVAGRGLAYGVTMASVVAVLCLSANTSFADFPRLWRLLALDRFAPEAFSHAGARLVYDAGIVLLALLSGLLLIAFRGVTDRLIPLFAVGAFLAFTLSQAGMVAHWWRRRGQRGARWSLSVNLVGVILTSAALGVIVVAKFVEGAWLSALCVPALVVLFRAIRARFERMARSLETSEPLDVAALSPPLVVVPIRHLHRVARKALRLACGMSPDVHAVAVHSSDRECEDLAARWGPMVATPARRAGVSVPRLVQLRTQYRQVGDPLLTFVRRLAAENPGRFVAVVIPDLVEARWYHYLLFTHTATLLKLMLRYRGGSQVVVVDAPWYLDRRRRRWRSEYRTRARPGLRAEAAGGS